jgi:pyruvate,water dikinase
MSDPTPPAPIEVPAGYFTRSRRFERPPVPMERSVFLPVFSVGCRQLLAYSSGVSSAARTIGGWVYTTTPVDDLESYLRRLDEIAAVVATGEPLTLVRRWRERCRPDIARRIAQLRTAAAAGRSDRQLVDHVRDVVDLFNTVHDHYYRLNAAASYLLAELGTCCARLFEWSPEQTMRLYTGTEGEHLVAAAEFDDLVALAAGLPAVASLLDDAVDIGAATEALPRLAGVSPRFAASFADHLHRYGDRTDGFVLTRPTLAEQPALLLNRIRAALDAPGEFAARRTALAAARADALDEADRILAERPAEHRAQFDRALADSLPSTELQDEQVFYAMTAWALLRYSVLEVGRRLAARDVLGRAEDVFYLELDEALAALRAGEGIELGPTVSRRRAEHSWALANPGPPTYGPVPEPLLPEAFFSPPSPAVRHLVSMAQWSMARQGRR